MSLSAQAEVVEDILLHGVQVGIFHLDLLSGGVTEKFKHKSHNRFLIQLKFPKDLLDVLVAHTVE